MPDGEYVVTRAALMDCSKIIYDSVSYYESDKSVEADLIKGVEKSAVSGRNLDSLLFAKGFQVSPERKSRMEVREGKVIVYEGRPQEREYNLAFILEINGKKKIIGVSR